MAQHTSYYIAELIRNGAMKSVLTRLRKVYAERAGNMIMALARELPAGSQILGGAGGYFIWIKLPETMRRTSTGILEIARDRFGVHALSGGACEVPGSDNQRNWEKTCIRISLSKLENNDALEGIRLLGLAIKHSESS